MRWRLLFRIFGGGDGQNKKIHWVKWDSLCRSKRDGGMGFRDLLLISYAWETSLAHYP